MDGNPGGAGGIDGLVRDDGRVHSAIYTSQAIFDLEMERIFHRGWVYVGHESEVPKAGDYRRRTIGRQPVILVRGSDGRVRVLANRCRHRGALVCENDKGNAKQFRCWYHGWSYDDTGRLISVHAPEGYDQTLDFAGNSLTEVPRLERYRGFLFASFAPSGKSLAEHLGRAAGYMDISIDASPAGEVALDYGVHRTKYHGNWKLVGMDGYHPTILHASMFSLRSRMGQASYQDPWEDGSASVTRHLDNGHVMLDLTGARMHNLQEHLDTWEKVEGGPEYVRAMRAAYGRERGDYLLAQMGDPHMGVFPNLQLIGSHARVIVPIAPDLTEVHMFPMRLLGVPDGVNEYRLRRHEFSYGPASFVSPDDAEIFERTQVGMMAEADPWLNLTRGMRRETRDADGSIAGRITDEIPQRYQLRAWKDMMTEAA